MGLTDWTAENPDEFFVFVGVIAGGGTGWTFGQPLPIVSTLALFWGVLALLIAHSARDQNP